MSILTLRRNTVDLVTDTIFKIDTFGSTKIGSFEISLSENQFEFWIQVDNGEGMPIDRIDFEEILNGCASEKEAEAVIVNYFAENF